MGMSVDRMYDLKRHVNTTERVLRTIKADNDKLITKNLFKEASEDPVIITKDKRILDDLSKTDPKELELLLIHGLISDEDFDDNYVGECTHNLTLKNSIIKFKLDDSKYVDKVVYIVDSNAYIKRKSGRHKGEFLLLKDHSSFVKEADSRYPNRSARLIMNVGGHGKVRVSSLYHVSKEGRINISYDDDYIMRYKGKLKIEVGNHDIFFISCTDEIENVDKVKMANLNIFLDITALRMYIPMLKYAYFNWLMVNTMKLSEERFMLDKTQLNIVPKLLKENETLCDLINANRLTKNKRLNASIEVPKNIDMQSVYVPLQRDDISTLMITPGKLYFEKQHEYYNQPHINESHYLGIEHQYVVSFVYKDKVRILRVDEDKIHLVVWNFSDNSIDKLIDSYKFNELSNESRMVVEGKATHDRRRMLEKKVLEEKRLKKEKEDEIASKIKTRASFIKQQSIEYEIKKKCLKSMEKTPYLSTQEKINNYLDLKDLTDEEVISLKNGEGEYFEVFEYVEIPEPFDFSFSTMEPEDENVPVLIDEDEDEEIDSITHIEAAPIWTGDHIGEGKNKQRNETRIKSLRVIQGKKNCFVGYPAGAVIPGRMRMTYCNRVVVEPIKGDTAALVFKYDDVADLINNGEVMRLASIPHERIIHIGKGLELLTNGFNYINPTDWV